MNTGTRIIIIILLAALPLRNAFSQQDTEPPGRPYITYVTIDTSNNNTQIYWDLSPSTDVEWYFIYYETFTVSGFEGIKIDSVDASVSSYTHINTGAGQTNLLYSVTAADSSGNESLRTPGLHSTIHNTLKYDSCENHMTISWNKYIGWDDKISGYKIFISRNGADFTVLDGVGITDSVYIQYNIEENTSYRYFIEAVKNDGLISRSGISYKFTFMPPPPSDLELLYVTIPEQNIAEISFTYQDITAVNDFVLLRSSVKESDFIPIEYAMDVTVPYVYIDPIISSSDKYFYKVGAVNTCRKLISTSNSGVNILLTGEIIDEEIHLSWNQYEDWSEGVSSYQVLRMDENGVFTEIGIRPPGSTNIIDPLNNIPSNTLDGNLEYKVIASRTNSDINSVSNILYIQVNSMFDKTPNAFTPNDDGVNDIFRPILNFIPEKYLIVIYDRYGVPVFESESLEEGWDGLIHGNKKATEGVYIYHIQFTSFDGRTEKKTGKVTVYYPR